MDSDQLINTKNYLSPHQEHHIMVLKKMKLNGARIWYALPPNIRVKLLTSSAQAYDTKL